MRTKKHYEDLLTKNPNASIGFTLAADMVFAAQHGSIDTPNVHGDEKWKNIARMLKQKYGENLTGARFVMRCPPLKPRRDN